MKHRAIETIANGVRKTAVGLMFAAATLTAFPTAALACTQMWVPSQFTATGDRYVGRSEDYAPRHVKIFGIAMPEANKHYTSDESDFDWTSDKTSYRYTYVRDHPSDWDNRTDAYSEAGINEKGVSCSATLTTNMNVQFGGDEDEGIEGIDPLTDTGIGEYNYADVILGEAATAREAVELLGSLIDQYGTSGNDQVTISDANESWLFCALSGHQWLGFQLPDDKVSVNPNMGNLRFSVDLENTATCLHSEDLITLPQQHGLLKTFADGTPDISATYGASDSEQGTGQNTRYVQGRAYFQAALPEDSYTLGEKGVTSLAEAPQLFFTPGRSDFSTYDVLRSTAARGEGTNVDANKNPGFYAIGNNRTVETHMFQIRDGLSPDIATVQWEALSRSEFSVAIPLYSALLTEVSPYFNDLSISEEHQGNQRDDSVEQALKEEPANSLPFVLMDLNTLCYNNRETVSTNTAKWLAALQKQFIAQQDAVDAAMQATPAGEQRTALANKAEFSAAENLYRKAKTTLDEIRAYLKAGDTSQPFTPSDYDAATGDLKTPITYANDVAPAPEPEPEPEVKMPVITTQPQSATYEQGAKAADLTVQATGDGELSYEWFTKAADGTLTSTGVKSAAMPVSTTAAGSTTYVCRVSNQAGSVDSQPATITVTEKAAATPNPKQDGTTTTNKTATGSLPATGDMNAFYIALVIVAGIALCALGAWLGRRNRNK